MTVDCSGDKKTYSQEDVDALAYSYVLSHGYEGALSMFAEFIAHRAQYDAGPDAELAALCRRIVDAIDDESATITRILDRMIRNLNNDADPMTAAVAVPFRNPIDQHIGDCLRQRRCELGLSLVMLANDLVLTPETLAAIEAGAARCDAELSERAARRLGIPAAYFFRRSLPDENTGIAAQ